MTKFIYGVRVRVDGQSQIDKKAENDAIAAYQAGLDQVAQNKMAEKAFNISKGLGVGGQTPAQMKAQEKLEEQLAITQHYKKAPEFEYKNILGQSLQDVAVGPKESMDDQFHLAAKRFGDRMTDALSQQRAAVVGSRVSAEHYTSRGYGDVAGMRSRGKSESYIDYWHEN